MWAPVAKGSRTDRDVTKRTPKHRGSPHDRPRTSKRNVLEIKKEREREDKEDR